MFPTSKRIFVAGHRGMVGAALMRALRASGAAGGRSPGAIELVTREHGALDLVDQSQVRQFFASHRIDEVYLAAARVGGIFANANYPAEFIYQNLMIEANIVHEAWRAKVGKLLFLGSSCIYPKLAPQPMAEHALLTGPLEPTNEPYAIAKIAGIKMCESYNRQYGSDFRSVMPTNLFGPGDNYHAQNSHVIPALLRRFHQAKLERAPAVVLWGSGAARREFLYVDDLASACLHVMGLSADAYRLSTVPMQSHLNVGSGVEVTIAALAQLIGRVTGYQGAIEFDPTQPEGPPRKLLDTSALRRLGWQSATALESGLRLAYRHFCAQQATAAA